ncbi:MAG TPA: CRTAC1 family protein [Gemmatimonadaceae bacterium]|nr:CRTAC1 family protein [Gemmatimonadaceae bacterium]
MHPTHQQRPTTLALAIALAIALGCAGAREQPQGTSRAPAAPARTAAGDPGELFVRVTEGRIAIDGGQSRGVAWGDYDGDGDPDLFVANTGGQWSFLYRNDGGGAFTKMRGHELVSRGANSEGASWADVDDDGDLDLFVLNSDRQRNFLFLNHGGGHFVRDTSDAAIVTDAESSVMACWADYDADGDVDVYVVNRDGQDDAYYVNGGGGRFERVRSGVLGHDGGNGRTCAAGDIDGDGDVDLYVGNAREPKRLYRNDGGGAFTELRDAGEVIASTSYNYGSSFADYDGDGDLDLLVTNIDRRNDLYRNDGRGHFTRDAAALPPDSAGASKGQAWGDFDNDGDLDLFVANGTYGPDQRNYLYLNRGDTRPEGTRFERVMRGRIATDADTSAGTAAADVDGDGDLDLFAAAWGSNDQDNAFYRNVAGSARGRSLVLRAEGRRSNRMALGLTARAKATIGGRPVWITRWLLPSTGYGSQNDLALHFGLGDAARVDSLVLRWPSGLLETFTGVETNRAYRAVEGAGLTPIR